MSIPTLIKSYPCSADIGQFLIAKFSDVSASNKIAPATAATDNLVGAVDKMGGVSGGLADVIKAGIGRVKLGNTVQAGDPLTTDANSKAIKAVGASGAVHRIIGYAEEPGVADDVIPYFAAPGVIKLP